MKRFKEVRKAMIDRDLTTKKLAEMTGYSVSRISDAVNGRKVADKVKRTIAFALKEPYERLWRLDPPELQDGVTDPISISDGCH